MVTSFAKDGNLAWRFDAQVRIDAAAVGPEGTFYIGLKNGSFLALNSNGHVKWDFVASCLQDNYRCYVPDAIHLDNDGSIFLRTAGTDRIKWPAYLYLLSSGGKLAWRTEVSAPSYYSAAGDLQPLASPWLGKRASKDLIFVRGVGKDFGNLTALSKSDGKLRWTCSDCAHSTYDNAPTDLTTVAADGDLITTRPDGSIRKLSAQDGSVLWTFGTPRSFQHSKANGLSAGSDGTVYKSYQGISYPYNSPGGIVAISAQGEFKWNVSIPADDLVAMSSHPSEQDDKGNIILARMTCTSVGSGFYSCHGDSVTIHPDGSQTVFAKYPIQCPCGRECEYPGGLPKPIKRPDGLVYFQMCGVVQAFYPNGVEKIDFLDSSAGSWRGPPTFADDGTIYIERDVNGPPGSEDSIYVVQVASETGVDVWKHRLSDPQFFLNSTSPQIIV